MRVKKSVSLLFAILLFFLWSQNSAVYAEDNFSYMKIDVSTDKQQYEVGEEIHYNLAISNTSGNAAHDIVVTTTIPDGLEVVKTDATIEGNKKVWKLANVGAYQEIPLQFTLKLTEKKGTETPPAPDINIDNNANNGGNNGSVNSENSNMPSPKTGDNTSILKYVVLFVVAGAAMILAIIALKKKKVKKGLPFLLIVSLAVPSFTIVHAEEQKESVKETYKVTINDKEYETVTTVDSIFTVDTTLMLKAERIMGVPQLQWNAVEGATYQVYRGLSPEKLEVVASELQELTYADTDSKNEETYYYKVSAMKDGTAVYESGIVMVKEFTDQDQDGLADDQENVYQTDSNAPDSDEDGLTDGEEVVAYNTDPVKQDTDEDQLTDGKEIQLTGTDPLKKDTDDNGITDDREDPDQDTLPNSGEIKLGTDPITADSDYDGLRDDQELTEKTNPINEDSDQDGLLDGNELMYNTDPLKQDTDGDGILDGEEEFSVTIETKESEKDEKVVPSLQMNLKGKEIGTVSISNVGNSNPYLHEGLPGYIGAPYAFSTQASFASAQMTFTVTPEFFNNDAIEPAIYYFNEETKQLELLPDQTVDKANGTITVTVSHFSTYIVLNKKAVDEVWEKEMKPPLNGEIEDVKLAIAFALDSSGSMWWNDPDDIRKQTAKEFVDKLDDNDTAAVIDFDHEATVNCNLTNNKKQIKACIDSIDSSGGTDIGEGMRYAIDEVKQSDSEVKYIILLTDGQGYYDESLTQEAKDLGIVVYTIGLGDDIDEELLTRIAEGTGGKYYYAETADELGDSFDDTSEETIDLATDKDEDGLSDYHEKRKIRTNNGDELQTDVNNPDTDGDGLKDGEELIYNGVEDGNGYFVMKSDPLKRDTDNDGIGDLSDDQPLAYNITDRTLALVAGVSYTNLFAEQGNTIADLINEGFTFETVNDYVEPLRNWEIVQGNDSGDNSSTSLDDKGLASVAVKTEINGRDVIIYGIRGTEPNDDAIADLITDIKGGALKHTNQSVFAYAQYKTLIKDYPNADFYLAGHSLGGRIVQDVLYQAKDEKKSIKMPLHSATFNALGYNIGVYFWWLNNDVTDALENSINNYFYEYDYVGGEFGASWTFKRIGTDIGPWKPKNKDGLFVGPPWGRKYYVKLVHGIDRFLYDDRLNYPNIPYLQ
ncbi:VWA domain-containing protein [Bacillaceae bacterium Marseille-Q3522]|nr:VWA domain-containing protein [Bacillaceae bacterium Marseille-Q3522]